jgi:hypothetical protein
VQRITRRKRSSSNACSLLPSHSALSIVPCCCCCCCTSLLHYDQILLHAFSVLLLLWPSQRPCACLTHPYPRKKHVYLVVLGLLKHRFQSERDPLCCELVPKD